MKKLMIAILAALPMMAMAQTTLTPQEQLQQAQRDYEAAQAALEQARLNAERAQAQADSLARVQAAQAQADSAALAEAEALRRQTEALRQQAKAMEAEASQLTTAPQPAATAPQQPAQAATAPQQWVQPTTTPAPSSAPQTTKTNDMSRYTAEGAVPVVDGCVEWSTTIDAPGLSATQVYDKLLTAMQQLTQGEDELEGSKVALVNPENHSIAATMREYLTFTNNFLSLDRTECYYLLEAQCHDGKATVTMSRIKYVYTTQQSVERYTAEEWITDKVAVNKKHTKLYRITGKFRRATIDRKDAVFQHLANAIKLL